MTGMRDAVNVFVTHPLKLSHEIVGLIFGDARTQNVSLIISEGDYTQPRNFCHPYHY